MSKLLEEALRLEDEAERHEMPFWFAFMDFCLTASYMPEWMFYDDRFNAREQFSNKLSDFRGFVKEMHPHLQIAFELALAFKHSGVDQDRNIDLESVESRRRSKQDGFGGKFVLTPVFKFVDGAEWAPPSNQDFCRIVMSQLGELEDEFLTEA